MLTQVIQRGCLVLTTQHLAGHSPEKTVVADPGVSRRLDRTISRDSIPVCVTVLL